MSLKDLIWKTMNIVYQFEKDLLLAQTKIVSRKFARASSTLRKALKLSFLQIVQAFDCCKNQRDYYGRMINEAYLSRLYGT